MTIIFMCWIGLFVGYVIAAVVIEVIKHRSLNKERTAVGLETKPLINRRVRA